MTSRIFSTPTLRVAIWTLPVLVALALCLPTFAAEAPQGFVPFQTVVTSKEDPAATYVLPVSPPRVSFKMVGGGEWAPLGKFTHIEQGILQFGVDEKPLSAEVTAVMTGANGEAIYLRWCGLSNRSPEEYAFIVTGGAGMFRGATGSGMMTATFNEATGEFTCAFDGFISEPRP